MLRIFGLFCIVGLAASKPGYKFGTNYGTSGILSYVPDNVISVTPTPYTPTHFIRNTAARTASPVFVSTTPAPQPTFFQYSRPFQYFTQPRRPKQPPRIDGSAFRAPQEQGFISSTASPPLGVFGGPPFGSTPAPPTFVPIDNFNGNPFPVEVTNPGFGGITSVGTSVFEVPDETPEVNKYFYIHSAPEEPEDVSHRHVTIGKPQKTYRVVFIRAPSSNGQAHISASFAPKEEKTVIYVLTKKPNQVEIKDIITPPPTQPSKPEVIFIKYKTKEEALHAQQTIQAQYDQLNGQSQVSDEGIAPVTSVIGILNQVNANPQQNEILSDQVVAVTPTPLSAIGFYPAQQQQHQQFKSLDEPSDE